MLSSPESPICSSCIAAGSMHPGSSPEYLSGSVMRCQAHAEHWRESVRTMLTEDTKNAFMCVEMTSADRLDDLNAG